ncbi:hypothetical protein AAUPMC_01897, partial [Pasteurella multocida subsp. multocida str. Anand1_cattle]
MYLFELETENQLSNKENWKASANKAILTKENMLYLEGNVVVESLLSPSRLQRVETESAVINLSTQDISSEHAVKIYGQH